MCAIRERTGPWMEPCLTTSSRVIVDKPVHFLALGFFICQVGTRAVNSPGGFEASIDSAADTPTQRLALSKCSLAAATTASSCCRHYRRRRQTMLLEAGASGLHWTPSEAGEREDQGKNGGRPSLLSLPEEAPHTKPLGQEVQTRPRAGRETQAALPRAPAPPTSPPRAPFGDTGSPGARRRKGAHLPQLLLLPTSRGSRGSGAALKARRAPGVHSAVFGWLQ